MIDLAAQIGLKRPQAVLLVGGKDTGKFEMARKIAALYIQEQYPHPDIIVYEPSRKTPKGRPILSIDEVRDIVNRATMPPMFASDIVVVIRDIHLATIPASNAILKVLEEPGATTKFILTTTNAQALLPTIVSRCSTYHVIEEENADLIDELEWEYMVDRTIVEYVAEVLNSPFALEQAMQDLTGVIATETDIMHLAKIAKRPLHEALSLSAKITIPKDRAKEKATAFLVSSISAITRAIEAKVDNPLVAPKKGSDPFAPFDLKEPFKAIEAARERIKYIASLYTLEELESILDANIRVKEALRHPVQTRLACDVLLLAYGE